MNRLHANLCLLSVTLCWSAEVVLYACIPAGVPAFATTCVTGLAGAALLEILKALKDGAGRADAIAQVTMKRVRKAFGLGI